MTLPNMRTPLVSREFLRIAGGFEAPALGTSPAGGLDVDNAGNLATDGDITTKGEVDVRGGAVKNSTGNLTLDAQNNAADSTIFLKNSDATYKANVDIEGNATVGGDLSIGGVFENWSVWIPAREMWPAQDGPCAGPTRTRWDWLSETQTLDFVTALDKRAAFSFALPAGYDGRQLKVTYYWTASTGTGGNVLWACMTQCLKDNETIVIGSGSPGVADDFLAQQKLHVCSHDFTADGFSGGEEFILAIVRRKGANDTFDGTAMLIGIRITYA